MKTLIEKTALIPVRNIAAIDIIARMAMQFALLLSQVFVKIFHPNCFCARNDFDPKWRRQSASTAFHFASILFLVVVLSSISAHAAFFNKPSVLSSCNLAVIHVHSNAIMLAQADVRTAARALLDFVCIFLILVGVGLIARAGIQVADGRYFEAFASFVGGFILVMAKAIILYLASIAGINL